MCWVGRAKAEQSQRREGLQAPRTAAEGGDGWGFLERAEKRDNATDFSPDQVNAPLA